MIKIMGDVVPWIVLFSLFSVCHGGRDPNPNGHGQDYWALKLSLNSSFELGGRVHRSSYPPGFVFGSAGSAYQVLSSLLFNKFYKKLFKSKLFN
jgi:hypothetical protein